MVEKKIETVDLSVPGAVVTTVVEADEAVAADIEARPRDHAKTISFSDPMNWFSDPMNWRFRDYEVEPLTKEELTPTESDWELGRRLVAEGWKSISRKYRTVKRWKDGKEPKFEHLVKPELLDTPEAKYFIQHCLSRWTPSLRDPHDLPTEEMTLTITQYIAFRKSGGKID